MLHTQAHRCILLVHFLRYNAKHIEIEGEIYIALVGGGVIDEELFVLQPLPYVYMLTHALINKRALESLFTLSLCCL